MNLLIIKEPTLLQGICVGAIALVLLLMVLSVFITLVYIAVGGVLVLFVVRLGTWVAQKIKKASNRRTEGV